MESKIGFNYSRDTDIEFDNLELGTYHIYVEMDWRYKNNTKYNDFVVSVYGLSNLPLSI